MKNFGLTVFCVNLVYGSVQQMVIADVAQKPASDNQVASLVAEAKDELPPELRASLLKDLKTKQEPQVLGGDYSAPHVSNSAVLAWANEAMVATFSYDFINLDKAKQTASNYYTPDGWKVMSNVHNELGDETAVINEQLVASAVAISAPKIIKQENIENRYSWLIEMPVLLTLTKTGQVRSTKVLTRMMVVRDNPQVHDRGMAINNIAVKKI